MSNHHARGKLAGEVEDLHRQLTRRRDARDRRRVHAVELGRQPLVKLWKGIFDDDLIVRLRGQSSSFASARWCFCSCTTSDQDTSSAGRAPLTVTSRSRLA